MLAKLVGHGSLRNHGNEISSSEQHGWPEFLHCDSPNGRHGVPQAFKSLSDGMATNPLREPFYEDGKGVANAFHCAEKPAL